MHRIKSVKKTTAFFTFGLLIAALCILPALAQGTGGIKGRLRNVRGELIAGATITARQNSKDIRSAKTGSKGEFLIDGLDAGVYNILFDAKGYSSGVRFSVEVKQNKIKDLGDRLTLTLDRGTRVFIRGSVFFKDGTSAPGAVVEMSKVGPNGSVQTLGQATTNYLGEFSFSQPEGAARLRFKATYQNGTGGKEIEVDSAMVYRLGISLDVSRPEK